MNRLFQCALRNGLVALLLAATALAAPDDAQNEKKAKKGHGQKTPPVPAFLTEVPEQAGSVVLVRPEKNAVTLSLLLRADAGCVLVWGADAKALPAAGRAVALKAGVPQEVTLDGLAPDTPHFYELRDAATGRRVLPLSGPGTFHTARLPGSAFTFTITADSHLDEHTSPAVYQRTLANALADGPDFHLELGDTFMTEKHPDRASAFKQYLAQRYYFGALCHSAPLFFVLGNHDGESPRGRDDSLAVWSCRTRKTYFQNPVPDGFFSGNGAKHPEAGLLQDYYAWEWGDALFVALDPFWHTQNQRGQRDNWKYSLGDAQYQWLKRTLEGSRASFKFVFIHHLVGGFDQCRGGVEAAPLYEWGGKNADGTDGFKEHRPGWPMPVHQLLIQNRVNVVFHGHDHLYANQTLDGIVYQDVPQPGDPKGSSRSALEYGYKAGTLLGSSGHMRVKVSPEKSTLEYVRDDGTVAHSYVVSGSSPNP